MNQMKATSMFLALGFFGLSGITQAQMVAGGDGGGSLALSNYESLVTYSEGGGGPRFGGDGEERHLLGGDGGGAGHLVGGDGGANATSREGTRGPWPAGRKQDSMLTGGEGGGHRFIHGHLPH